MKTRPPVLIAAAAICFFGLHAAIFREGWQQIAGGAGALMMFGLMCMAVFSYLKVKKQETLGGCK